MRSPEWTSDDGTIALHHCSAEELLLSIGNESVDLVVTSPPFNTLDQETCEHGLRATRANGDAFLTKWNGAGYDDAMPEEQYQDWVRSVVVECMRVSKSLAWINQKPRGGVKRGVDGLILPERWLPWPIHSRVIWDRHGAICMNCGRFPVSDETFLAFGRKGYWDQAYGAPKLSVWSDVPEPDADVIWSNVLPSRNERHPCPWPVEIPRRFVRANCPPGGTVLDCFMGQATTARACIRTGRTFIGCEINAQFFSWAIEAVQAEHGREIAFRQRELEEVA